MLDKGKNIYISFIKIRFLSTLIYQIMVQDWISVKSEKSLKINKHTGGNKHTKQKNDFLLKRLSTEKEVPRLQPVKLSGSISTFPIMNVFETWHGYCGYL